MRLSQLVTVQKPWTQYHRLVLRARLACYLTAIVAIGSSACASDPKAAPVVPTVPTVRIGTSGAGGGFQAFAQALEPEMKVRLTTVNVEMTLSRGAIDNLAAVARGDLDCGFTFADVAYEAFANGYAEGSRVPITDVRALAVLQVTPVQFIARAGSGIERIEDLQGRRVSIGPTRSPSGLLSRVLAEAQATGREIIQVPAQRAQVPEMMAARELDAAFAVVIYAEGFASAIANGAHLVPITGPVVDRLRKSQPFLRTVLLPAGTYGDRQAAVPTIGVDSLMVCRRQLGETLIRDLTRGLLESMQVLARSEKWHLVPLDDTPATSIPLHPGASLYYREMELMR